MQRIKLSIRDMWNTVKQSNIYLIRVIEGRELENGAEAIYAEKIVKKFRKLMIDIIPNIKEAQ